MSAPIDLEIALSPATSQPDVPFDEAVSLDDGASSAESAATSADAEIAAWVKIAGAAAADKLGQDTEAFFVGSVLGITDWFVVTSGANGRQVRAIVEGVEEQLTLAGGPKPNRVEGLDTVNWVLMDYGSFVVHVFDAESRGFYELERLWQDVPRLDLELNETR